MKSAFLSRSIPATRGQPSPSRLARLAGRASFALQPPKRARLPGLASVTLAVLLSACASTPDSHFYTLSSDAARTSPAAADALLIELLPVNVPSQVARPQIVTTVGPGNVRIDEYHRWASPLTDEINSALSQSLTASLGAIDIYRAPRPTGAQVYRITVNVQRFESVPGSRATIGAVWSVVRASDSLTMTCQTNVSEPVGEGFDSLAAGHRQALQRIAADIAAGVRAERAAPPLPPVDMTVAPPAAAQSPAHASARAASIATVTPSPATPPVLACPS